MSGSQGGLRACTKHHEGSTLPLAETQPELTSLYLRSEALAKIEAEILADQWLNPEHGQVPFGQYARDWITERPELRPKTVELYRYLLRRHLNPTFAAKAVADIKEPQVRKWRSKLLADGVSAVTVAKAYRLLKAIFATAADDGAIRRNPCRIKGAGQESSPERPVLTPAQVFALVEVIDQRYRALVLLGTFTSLRWGELAALRRRDIDLAARTVRVERQLTEVRGQGLIFGPPKSNAGRRTVPIPESIVPAVRWHLGCFAADGDDGLIFTSPTGEPLRHSNFRRRLWVKALAAAGLTNIHFHDLRHTGNHMAATAGATLRELMDRMGHSTTKAALTYLHGSDARQHQIADTLSKIARDEMRRTADRAGSPTATKRSGTQRARRPKKAS